MEVKIYQELLNIKNKTIQVHYGLQTAGNMKVHQEKYSRKSTPGKVPPSICQPCSSCPCSRRLHEAAVGGMPSRPGPAQRSFLTLT